MAIIKVWRRGHGERSCVGGSVAENTNCLWIPACWRVPRRARPDGAPPPARSSRRRPRPTGSSSRLGRESPCSTSPVLWRFANLPCAALPRLLCRGRRRRNAAGAGLSTTPALPISCPAAAPLFRRPQPGGTAVRLAALAADPPDLSDQVPATSARFSSRSQQRADRNPGQRRIIAGLPGSPAARRRRALANHRPIGRAGPRETVRRPVRPGSVTPAASISGCAALCRSARAANPPAVTSQWRSNDARRSPTLLASVPRMPPPRSLQQVPELDQVQQSHGGIVRGEPERDDPAQKKLNALL